MKSIFELKTKTTVDLAVFERMKEKATEMLSEAEKSQYTQAVVLLSVSGNEYGAIIKDALSEEKEDEAFLIQKIREAKDTEICCALCMWHDKSIDIPSFALRKLILAANPNNSKTLIYVMTANGVSVIKLSETIK
jgi:hypothetical protein